MNSGVGSDTETPQPCHCGDGRHFFCTTEYSEVTIVESGMHKGVSQPTSRIQLSQLQQQGQCWAGGCCAPTCPLLPCPYLRPSPCFLESPARPHCWSEGSGRLSFIPGSERTSRMCICNFECIQIMSSGLLEVLPSLVSLGLCDSFHLLRKQN